MTRNPFQDGEPFSTAILNSMNNAHANEGVLEGCTLSTGSGDWDIDISSGRIVVDSKIVDFDADTVVLGGSNGDDRVDLVTVDSDGESHSVEGDPAEDVGQPVAPDIPENEVVVGLVYIRGGSSEVLSGDLYNDYKTIIEEVQPWLLDGVYSSYNLQAGEPPLSGMGYVGDSYTGPQALHNNVTGRVDGVGTVISEQSSLTGSLRGVEIDPADGTIWIAANRALNPNLVTQYNRNGDEIQTVVPPEEEEIQQSMGLDPKDGTIWVIVASETVYHIDRDGDTISSFQTPADDAYGITVDPVDGTLWHTDRNGDFLHHTERTGDVIDSREIPGIGSVRDLSIDPFTGSFWMADNGENEFVEKSFDDLRTIRTIDDTAGDQSVGVAVDPADGTIWYTNSQYSTLHHVNTYDHAWTVEIDGEVWVLPRGQPRFVE